MPNQLYDCVTPLPFYVLRWVNAFGPRMRNVMVKALQARQATKDRLTIQDMSECIDMAWTLLQADVEMRVQYPPPDSDAVAVALEEARRGEVTTIDEILDELS